MRNQNNVLLKRVAYILIAYCLVLFPSLTTASLVQSVRRWMMAEVRPTSNQYRFDQQRYLKEDNDKKSGKVATSAPSPAPSPSPTKGVKTKDGDQFNAAAGNEKWKDNTFKTFTPTSAPTIPKVPRQVEPPALSPFFPPSILPPSLLVPTAPTTTAPTPVIDVPTVEPTPVDAPVAVPVPLSVPVPVPIETVEPTISPVLIVSESPSAVPVEIPDTDSPTLSPTEAPVTEAPSDTPSLAPTYYPSELPSSMLSDVPTLLPTIVPSNAPTISFELVDIIVMNISIVYPNVTTELNDEEILQLEQLTESWFEDFYNSDNDNTTSSMTNSSIGENVTLPPQRRLLHDRTIDNSSSDEQFRNLQIETVRDMNTLISIQSQVLQDDGSNLVTYNQQLQYKNVSGLEILSPNDIVVYPFRQVRAVTIYRERLMNEIVPAFSNVGTIEPPKIDDVPVAPTAPTVPAPTAPTPTPPTDKDLSSASIAGIAVGGLLFLSILGYAFIILPHELKPTTPTQQQHEEVVENDEPDSNTMTQTKDKSELVPVSSSAAIGTTASSSGGGIGAGATTAIAATAGIAGGAAGMAIANRYNDKEETSTLGEYNDKEDTGSYAGRSIDTSDFDYSKVGPASGTVFSSSPTIDPQRDNDDEGTAIKSAITKYSDSDLHLDENQFVIYAPAGKLGLVVDNPDDGAPVVHAIKEDSVLIDQVKVGDRLIGVDEVDVRSLSPVKVSKLISKRSTNPLRKLTLTRDKVDDDDETADGMNSRLETDTQSESQGGGVGTGRQIQNSKEESDDDTSHVGSMSHLSGDEEQESVLDYPDDGSSIVDAMSHTSGGIPASTVGDDEMKTTDSSVMSSVAGAAETTVGEETSETPTRRNIEP